MLFSSSDIVRNIATIIICGNHYNQIFNNVLTLRIKTFGRRLKILLPPTLYTRINDILGMTVLISILGQHRERFNSTSHVNITIVVVTLQLQLFLFSASWHLHWKAGTCFCCKEAFSVWWYSSYSYQSAAEGCWCLCLLWGGFPWSLCYYTRYQSVSFFSSSCFKLHCDLHDIKNLYFCIHL